MKNISPTWRLIIKTAITVLTAIVTTLGITTERENRPKRFPLFISKFLFP